MPRGFCLCLALAISAVFVAPSAAGDPVSVINVLRAGSCRAPGAKPHGLESSRMLDRVAGRIAAGAKLADAVRQSGFRARASRTLAASGIPDDAHLRALAQQRFCREIADPALSMIGIARRGDHIWIVLAEPFTAPALTHPRRVAGQVLQLVNLARAQSRRCGSSAYAAVGPLSLSRTLSAAADAHAADMIHADELTHRGSDGSDPGERARRAGYRWRIIGENLAAGPDSPQQVVSGWLGSPEHCANIMDPRFTQMGIAYRVDWSRDSGIYWAQEFGLPR